jgi:subtilisin family serine protease
VHVWRVLIITAIMTGPSARLRLTLKRLNMSKSGKALRGLCSGIAILLVASACQDAITNTPAQRSFAPAMSRIATAAPGRHVFVLNGGIPADFSARVIAAGGTVVSSMSNIGVVVTEGLADADAATLAGKNEVAPDYVAQWVPSPDQMQLSTASLSIPVDVASAKPPLTAFFLSQQWNMRQIQAPLAWATGRSGIPSVRVAILDTGLDPYHLDQAGVIDVASSVAYVPSTQGPPAWEDDNYHGTFVGGIVTSNNFGTAGVAPNVTLIAVKVLDLTGKGSFAGIIAGIYHATEVGAQVINMSLGALFPKNAVGASALLSAMNRAVNYAHSRGVLVVSAAGNDAVDLQHDGNFVEVPCEAGVQLCVSATGLGDLHASYSNYGTNAISVAAPGGDNPPTTATFIMGLCSTRSTVPPFDKVCKDGLHYMFADGTSFSAPHVSGLGAYLDSQFGGTLNASQLITLIQQNADDIGKPGADPYFGKGRINVLKTITTAQP